MVQLDPGKKECFQTTNNASSGGGGEERKGNERAQKAALSARGSQVSPLPNLLSSPSSHKSSKHMHKEKTRSRIGSNMKDGENIKQPGINDSFSTLTKIKHPPKQKGKQLPPKLCNLKEVCTDKPTVKLNKVTDFFSSK